MANRDVAAVRRAGARPQGEPATPPLLRSVKAWRVVTLVLVLAAWQLSSGPLVDPLLISSPSDVLGRLAHLLTGGEIWRHIGATYSEVGIGYALAAVIGIGAGVLLGRARFAARVLEPYIMAAYSIPKITLAPLFILWLGIGSQSKIGISFLSAVFLIFYATYTGIRHMDEELVTVARLLGARRFELVARVLLNLDETITKG